MESPQFKSILVRESSSRRFTEEEIDIGGIEDERSSALSRKLSSLSIRSEEEIDVTGLSSSNSSLSEIPKSSTHEKIKTILEPPKEDSSIIFDEEPKQSEEDKSLMKIKKLRKFFGAETAQLLEAQSTRGRMSEEQKKDLKKIQKLTKFFGDSAIPFSPSKPKKSSPPIEINSQTTMLELTEVENQSYEIELSESDLLSSASNTNDIVNFQEMEINGTPAIALPFSPVEIFQMRNKLIEEYKKANPNGTEPYTIVLGTKRGRCTKENCSCDIYLLPPNVNLTGSAIHPCIMCAHFPQFHKLVTTEGVPSTTAENVESDSETNTPYTNELNQVVSNEKVQLPLRPPLSRARSKSMITESKPVDDSPYRIPKFTFFVSEEHHKPGNSPKSNRIFRSRSINSVPSNSSNSPPSQSVFVYSTNLFSPTHSSTLSKSSSDGSRSTGNSPSASSHKSAFLHSTFPSNPLAVLESTEKSLNKVVQLGKHWLIDADELTFVEKLGVGSSAKVYKGKYRNQNVAIKVLKNNIDMSTLKNDPDSGNSTENSNSSSSSVRSLVKSSSTNTIQNAKSMDDFQTEFEIMCSLRSPYVVYFYGAVIEPKVCIVMEYCPRGTLYDLLKDDSLQLDWQKLFKFSIESVRGISCLHNWKPSIVHRDLKTLNLLVDANWTVKVGDFGLSRFLDGKQSTLGKLRGTYAYCATEIYYGNKFTEKSDIYSMGMILWELINKCLKGSYERPFGEYQLTFEFLTILQAAKHNLRPTIPPNCPNIFAELIKACWDPAPEKRPNSNELLTRLLDIQVMYEKEPKKWNDTIKKKKTKW